MTVEVPRLQFDKSKIREFAENYLKGREQEDKPLNEIKERIQRSGDLYLTKEELRKVARWKASRSAGHIEGNEEDDVEEITRLSLGAKSERMRVGGLLALSGVGWPTASVILHFFHKDPYPVLDYRALEACGIKQPSQYTFDFWWTYVGFCRTLRQDSGVKMRELDRALWQYSKTLES